MKDPDGLTALVFIGERGQSNRHVIEAMLTAKFEEQFGREPDRLEEACIGSIAQRFVDAGKKITRIDRFERGSDDIGIRAVH